MKIDVSSPALTQIPVDRETKTGSNASVTGAYSATEDRTTFSSDSTSVQSLTTQAMNVPAVRQDKVDALRQSVTSGSYQVDATKIADSIAGSNGG